MRGTVVVQRRKRQSAPNWGVIDDATVQDVAATVAKGLADMNQGILDVEDLTQEALILVAATPSLSQRAVMREYGTLYNELRMDLLDKFVRPLMRSGEMEQRKYKTVDIDAEDEDNEPEPTLSFDDGDGAYTVDAVKVLLPAVWDESYAYSLPDRDDAPDKDMPKASANKARSNNHWAYIADIKTGWAKTPLTLNERRALLLSFGMGWTQEDIAYNQDVDQSTISRRIDGGIRKIVARLNGAGIEEVS